MTRKRRTVRYKTIPVWVAKVTEYVFVNGQLRLNVVTKKGKPRTITMKD